jgi:hypothetical protein
MMILKLHGPYPFSEPGIPAFYSFVLEIIQAFILNAGIKEGFQGNVDA